MADRESPPGPAPADGPTTLWARFRRRSRSVSFRSGLWSALSVGAVASLAVFLLVSLAFVLFAVTGGIAQTNLIDRAEDQLRLGVEPEDLMLPGIDELNGPDGRPADDAGFWAVLEDGVVRESDGPVNREVIAAEFSDPGFGVQLDDEPTDDLVGLKNVDGEDWFYVERTVAGPNDSTYRLVTADDGNFSVLAFVVDSLVVTVPVVLILMAVAMLITSYLTRRALRRVENIRAEVEQITRESLDRRVPTADASDGIDKLAHTMNDMLGRLEHADAKQSQFLADASHELRSPVAGLLAQLDVAAAYPDRVDTAALLPKLRNEAQRLQLLVDDLLFLSRSEADGDPMAAGWTVDLDELVAAEVEHQLLLAPDLAIEAGALSGLTVVGSSRDLGRALRNLLSNAVRHCRERVTVEVVGNGDGQVTISVIDDGPGVPQEQADRIFDRFVRMDEARSRDVGGAGLGLAIAQEIAVRHRGRIRLRDAGGPGAVFELTLPLAPSGR